VLTDLDQLWRADITYVRLQEEFVFLAVILDGYSRRVIGWALDRVPGLGGGALLVHKSNWRQRGVVYGQIQRGVWKANFNWTYNY